MVRRRTPRFRYKVRKTTINNSTGDSYALTVPEVVAKEFEGVHLYLVTTSDGIVYRSGCAPNIV